MNIIGRSTSDTLKSLQFNTMTLEQAYPVGGGVLGEEMPQIGEDPGGYPSQARILYWYHPDYIQNVDLVTDLDGEAYELFLYNPWGEELHHWSSNSSSWTSPYRFNAKEVDPETGLAYYGARYYQSKLGVWLSVDPQNNILPTWSPYASFADNPVYFVDPDGQLPIVPLLIAAWAVVEIGISAYDAYETGRTLLDPNSTTTEKFVQTGFFALGLLAPGGGYGTMGKAALSKIDNALSLTKSSKSFRGLNPSASKLSNIFENTTASKIAERGDFFIGFGDNGVRKALGIKGSDKAADFVSVSQSGKFNIAESKAAFGSSGAEIGDALSQLQSTVAALKKNLPNAEIGSVQIFLPKGGSLKGGYSVSGNQLVKVVDGKTELQKVGGQVVNIVFQ